MISFTIVIEDRRSLVVVDLEALDELERRLSLMVSFGVATAF
jgi:hypothetical protein